MLTMFGFVASAILFSIIILLIKKDNKKYTNRENTNKDISNKDNTILIGIRWIFEEMSISVFCISIIFNIYIYFFLSIDTTSGIAKNILTFFLPFFIPLSLFVANSIYMFLSPYDTSNDCNKNTFSAEDKSRCYLITLISMMIIGLKYIKDYKQVGFSYTTCILGIIISTYIPLSLLFRDKKTDKKESKDESNFKNKKINIGSIIVCLIINLIITLISLFPASTEKIEEKIIQFGIGFIIPCFIIFILYIIHTQKIKSEK